MSPQDRARTLPFPIDTRGSCPPEPERGGPDIAAPRRPQAHASCAIGVFARAPAPGETKTRLIPELGAEGAARFYVASLLDTLAAVQATRFPSTVFCAPASGAGRLRRLGVEGEIVGQGGGDLGRRMQRALGRLLAGPRVDRAFLIGTDSPDLPAAVLGEASRALVRSPAVLAPATDGGYTLVGLRTDTLPIWQDRSLFAGVPWSSPETLAGTVARFLALGIRPRILTPWWDVDEPADLLALRGRLETQRALGTLRARHTEETLRDLLG